MKQVININFQGRVVPIEVSAFELLKAYIDSLSRHFSNELGKEEIINDIESRIGELFQERLKNGATCITDDDVNAVIKSMGRPEDFDGDEEQPSAQANTQQEEPKQTYQNTGTTFTHKRLYRDENHKVFGGVCYGIAEYFGVDPVIIRILTVVLIGITLVPYFILWMALPSTASVVIGSTRKKFYRDGDDKIIAGVCSGIGNYFGINAWIPRSLFLIPFLSFFFHWSHLGLFDMPGFFRISFSPGSLIVYIILWLVIPQAVTTAEKLEMKGEKVDMNSIKNSVMEEMKGVKQRAEKFGEEAKAFASEKSKTVGSDLGNIAKRSGRSFGDIIVLFIKIFAYFIIGVVSFSLVVALFGVAIAAVSVFPFKDFVIDAGWQNIFAWGTLLFFIGVPVIGIITWIIRKLAKMKRNSKVLRFTFISLWIVGWVAAVCLTASVSKQFKSMSDLPEENVTLANPLVNKIEITTNERWPNRNRTFRIEPFSTFDEDSVYINNVHFRIVKSGNDSFKLSVLKFSDGITTKAANATAAGINYLVYQSDTLLKTGKGIVISPANKFRNQQVVYTIYVPVGKQVKIDEDVWENNFSLKLNNISWNDDDNDQDENDYWGNEEQGWHKNTDYIMKADGLYTLDGKKASKDDDDNGDDAPDEEEIQQQKLDSMKQQLEKEKDSLNNQIQKKQEKISKPTHQDAFMAPVGLSRINTLL